MFKWMRKLLNKLFFYTSSSYWEKRYQLGGNSGAGSYGEAAKFKAKVLNQFIEQYKVQSIIEFGCGDGHQLSLAHYPRYIGLDVSKTAIQLCQQRFKQDNAKSFFIYHPEAFIDNHKLFQSEVSLSLDVIYHLVEDSIFNLYMTHLFASANRFVIIFATNTNENPAYQLKHVKHRQFSDWIKQNCPHWELLQQIPNEVLGDSMFHAQFFIYQKG